MNANLVGIISDTHDNMSKIAVSVSEFNRLGCSLVVHAGDFIAPFTAKAFAYLNCPFIGVFGNNDGEKKGLVEQFSRFGSIFEPPYEFTHYGKKFVVMHEPVYLDHYLARNDIDVLVYGHTHKPDIRPGRTVVINPGENCYWLTGNSSLVILDLDTMSPELIYL